MLKARASGVAILLAAGLAASAGAQPIGPDVVVSTIGPTFTKYGTLNTGTTEQPKLVSGYAVTTVSCNIGDAIAIWIDSVNVNDPNRNQHPVIGTQLYRIHNGRFEQIGMSWLKHGWCAADAPNCLNLARPGVTPVYSPHSSCDWLGLYATDTYSASLNGDQADLGPRSEVNPSNGAFPYPYQLRWNQTGNCIFKRLQVANDDLSPVNYPGAKYFCEVQYIPTDEKTTTGPDGESLPELAHIRANNASYREVIVGSLSSTSASGCPAAAGYTLAFTGNTVALKPAIEAWKALDPAVTLIPVDIPHDGRVIIGYKVSDLGDGLWNYEYAVYNHNSHRAVGSFSLPKGGASVEVSNIGFHDVDYHSGEPYSGADWDTEVTDQTLSWSTESYDANPNANAIRWSTAYNFRFQSNRAPATGSVTLGLFRPGEQGEPASISVPGVMIPSAACAADFNGVGGVSVQDLFDFLTAYFDNDAAADVNGVDGVTVQDVFDFLAAWFQGC